MRFLITLAATFFAFLPFVQANTVPTPVAIPSISSNLADKSLLLDITKAGDNKLVAVGHHGHIISSSDGQQWQQANVPVQATLTSVYFINENIGWAVGHDATILHTEDGGVNWQVQQFLPALEKPLLDVYFKDAKQGIAIGAYGMFFRTIDGGITWKTEFQQSFLLADDIDYLNELKADDEEAYLDEIAFILPHFNRITASGDDIYLIGEIGLIAKSTDFGQTWQQFDEIYQGSFFSLTVTQSRKLLVAGLRGHVFSAKATNESEVQAPLHWQEVPTDTTALLNDIVLSGDKYIYILGNNGTLLVSDDGGNSFIKNMQADGKSLIAGVWFKEQLIVASDVGIKSLDLNQ